MNPRYFFLLLIISIFFTVGCKESQKQTSSDKTTTPFGVSTIHWMTYSKAMDAYKKQKKCIMIYIYEEPCQKCNDMETIAFKDKKLISEMNQYFYAIKFNAYSKEKIEFQGKELGNPYNDYHQLVFEAKAMSIPAYSFYNENFEFLGSVKGYIDAPDIRSMMKMTCNY